MPDPALDVPDLPYQERLSSSVALPSCTMRLPERSSGSASPRFSRQSRTRAASSLPMMVRASEPPMKLRRSKRFRDIGAVLKGRVMTPSNSRGRATLVELCELRHPPHSEGPRTASDVWGLSYSRESA